MKKSQYNVFVLYASFAFLSITNVVNAQTLKVYPEKVTLRLPLGEQQIVAVSEQDGKLIADETGKAKYSSSDEKIATVSETGLIKRISPGDVSISASMNGKTASMKVKVLEEKGSLGWSFNQHVLPTLTKSGCNSGACHGALAGKGGFKLSLRGYDPESDWFAMTRQAQARRVDSAMPEQSLLLKKAVREIPHAGGTRFTDDSEFYRIIKEWIAAGATAGKADEPAIVGIDVYPPNRLAKPGEQFKLITVARFADGHTEDITRWSKLTSSEEQVAVVDDEGTIKIAGSGVAGVSVVFGTNVATATMTVPFNNKIETVSTAGKSYVDKLIYDKLNELKLSPSPAAGDAEFIRRAYLDSCGILPTPEEIDAYAADQAKDKKSKLIDKLLSKSEFVDYWTYRWCDLLLISTRDLPQSQTWSFYRSVRKAVSDNQPWNEFVSELLTASGSTAQNGSANYFVLHKDVAKLAETTSITFLGMSIGCAKCHNHPLEKWTQDQYWQFANLFSRVQLKNGDLKDEIIVTPSTTGNALHPRRGIAMNPAPLDGQILDLESTQDRRAHFAKWLTEKNNPFFAKSIVNRVWKAYLGRGLVEAEDDIRATNPASNPQLFEAVVSDFVEHRYDIKYLMKQILNSEAYGRSSTPIPANFADDRFYSRYFVRRLPAEVILDAYSQITTVTTEFKDIAVGASGGFAKKDDYPDGTRAVQLPDTLLVSRFLDQFGRAERQQACACERGTDSSVGQALHVSNGQTLNNKLRSEKAISRKWLSEKISDDELVKRSFKLCLGRNPNENESKQYTTLLSEAKTVEAKQELLEDIFWALLTGREFLFNH